ncbi:MAG: class I SAM-dependent methyltransferase [Phycisphaerae bacterium]|nr:class I SAM-dependent methyltransferase [Phycisphaerae bacterium]
MDRIWSDLIQPPEIMYGTRRWKFPPAEAGHWREVLRLPERGTICEVGCGPGGLLTRIAETSLAPSRIIGIDMDRGQLEFAGRRLAELGLSEVELLAGDACSMPLPDHCVDALTSHALIEHLPDTGAFFRECKRVLRPGGTLSVACAGGRYSVDNRHPDAPKELTDEIHQLERIMQPWDDALNQAYFVWQGGPFIAYPGIVRSWGLDEFRVDSWSKTICWDDHRLSEEDRLIFVRLFRSVPPEMPPTEARIREALAKVGAGAPATPYLTERERCRLRELYDERERLALEEVRKAGSGPFFATTVALVASGIVR